MLENATESNNIQERFRTADDPWQQLPELHRMPQNVQESFKTIQNQWEHFRMRQSTPERQRTTQNF